MLFVALLKTRPGSTFQEGGARRSGWEHPEGVKVLAEYWTETDLPRVVVILEAENMAPFGAVRMHRGDLFGIEAFPAMTGLPGHGDAQAGHAAARIEA